MVAQRVSEELKTEVKRRVSDADGAGTKFTIRGMLADLRREHRDQELISEGTLHKLVKEAREQAGETVFTVAMDPPWNAFPKDWPGEAYGLLIALERQSFAARGRTLTQREAGWGVALRSLLHDVPLEISEGVVHEISRREWLAEDSPAFLRGAFEWKDLIGFLQYRPWESDASQATWAMARMAGVVEPLEGPAAGLESRRATDVDGEIESMRAEVLAIAERLRSPVDREVYYALAPLVEVRDEAADGPEDRSSVLERLRLVYQSARQGRRLRTRRPRIMRPVRSK